MGIQRTPEEIAKWHKAAESEACSHGRLIAGIVWITVAVIADSLGLLVYRGFHDTDFDHYTL